MERRIRPNENPRGVQDGPREARHNTLEHHGAATFADLLQEAQRLDSDGQDLLCEAPRAAANAFSACDTTAALEASHMQEVHELRQAPRVAPIATVQEDTFAACAALLTEAQNLAAEGQKMLADAPLRNADSDSGYHSTAKCAALFLEAQNLAAENERMLKYALDCQTSMLESMSQ
jgi:hypothetical protein